MSIELPTLSNSHESIATTEEQSLNRGAVWLLWMHATWIGIRYKAIQETYERAAQCKSTICMESVAGVQTVILYSVVSSLFEYQRHSWSQSNKNSVRWSMNTLLDWTMLRILSETFDNIWFNNNILIYNLITFNYMH